MGAALRNPTRRVGPTSGRAPSLPEASDTQTTQPKRQDQPTPRRTLSTSAPPCTARPAPDRHVELQRVGRQAGWPAWPSLVSRESPVPSEFMM
jgi:hypothetical protein